VKKGSTMRVGAVAILGVLASGCGGSGTSSVSSPPATPAATIFTTYSDPTNGFSIGYPPAWDKETGVSGTVVAFLSPSGGTGDAFRENVNVIVEHLPHSMSLDAYTTVNESKLQQFITDYNKTGESDSTLGGSPSREIEYSGTQGQYQLNWLQNYTVQGDTAYVVTYTGTGSDFTRLEPTARQMFSSFQFT
jgi:eukaryotic-like serine/threonine-protein kinase